MRFGLNSWVQTKLIDKSTLIGNLNYALQNTKHNAISLTSILNQTDCSHLTRFFWQNGGQFVLAGSRLTYRKFNYARFFLVKTQDTFQSRSFSILYILEFLRIIHTSHRDCLHLTSFWSKYAYVWISGAQIVLTGSLFTYRKFNYPQFFLSKHNVHFQICRSFSIWYILFVF